MHPTSLLLFGQALSHVDYTNRGNDWEGTCSLGSAQSPVVFGKDIFPHFDDRQAATQAKLVELNALYLKEKRQNWQAVVLAQRLDREREEASASKTASLRQRSLQLEEQARKLRGEHVAAPSQASIQPHEEETNPELLQIQRELRQVHLDLASAQGQDISNIVLKAVDFHANSVQPRLLTDAEITTTYLTSNLEEKICINKGDFVYSYSPIESFISRVGPGVFSLQRRASDKWGLMVTTADMRLAEAAEIRIHSPAEHAFLSEGSRHPLELQIWHTGNDPLLPFSTSKAAMQSLAQLRRRVANDASLRRQLRRNKIELNQHESLAERLGFNVEAPTVKVISLFFADASAVGASSEADAMVPPTEKLLTSLLEISADVTNGGETRLREALQLDDVMLLLSMAEVGFVRYHGSDTTPPCEEGVEWLVAESPLPVSSTTLVKFLGLLSQFGAVNNARDVQNGKVNRHSGLNTTEVRCWSLFETIASNTRDRNERRGGVMAGLLGAFGLN